MNIIKIIKKIKQQRNLIIYDDKSQLELIKEKYNVNNWLSSSLPIYSIYYGKAYNPPFFNNIICIKSLNNKNSEELIHKIWNMTLYDGYIILITPHNKKATIMKKDSLKIYQFPKYRVAIDFIIAGTMKSGTTSAMEHFDHHPEISMPKKEIHYFDIKENYQKGIQWYKTHFNYSKKMVGDKAPDMMYMYSCLELLQMINPQVKIIVFLKNPIERAYSHWKMTRDLFGNKNSFEFCIDDELNNRMNENRSYHVSFFSHFIQRGFYFEQIVEILKYFPRENLHITISEKMRDNTDDAYQKVFTFLDVKNFHSNFEEKFVSKTDDKIDKNSKMYKNLKKIFKKDVSELEKFLGYKTGWW